MRSEYKSAKTAEKVQPAAAVCHRLRKLEKNNTKPLSCDEMAKMHKFASKIMAVKGVQNRLHSLHGFDILNTNRQRGRI